MRPQSPKGRAPETLFKDGGLGATMTVVAYGFFFALPGFLYQKVELVGWKNATGLEPVVFSLLGLLCIAHLVLIGIKRGRVPGSHFLPWVVLSLGFLSPWIQSPPYWFPQETELVSDALSNSGASSQIGLSGRVAHAGGGIAGRTHTNSIDALDNNLRHFDNFEIDITMTADGGVVCGRSWKQFWQESGETDRHPGSRPSYEEFLELSENLEYTPCTGATLVEWLSLNPTKKLILDVKDADSVSAYSVVKQLAGPLVSQIYPQIYTLDEFRPLEKDGWAGIIWTTYQSNPLAGEVSVGLQSFNFSALTIRPNEVAKLVPIADSLGIPVYVHTVNDFKELHDLRKSGVTEVYTDFLRDF